MSCTRNRLLMFELWTMIATVAMGLGALISGIFGMNLKSGLEEAPEKFKQVVVLIVTLGLLITTVSMAFIFYSQKKYQNHAARFGNNRFFKSIADDEYVLSLCSRPNGSALPEVQLDHVLRELRCPALPLSGPLAAASAGARVRVVARAARRRHLVSLPRRASSGRLSRPPCRGAMARSVRLAGHGWARGVRGARPQKHGAATGAVTGKK